MSTKLSRFFRRLYRRLRVYGRAGQLSSHLIWQRIKGGEILLFSSALAFSALLTMIPLLLLSASAVGILLSSSEMAVQQLNAVLDTMFPPQPFAVSIKDSILFLVSDLIRYRASLGVVGVVVLLVTATFVFDIVRTILHKVYGLPRKRNVVASFLHDVFFVFVAFVLLIATNLAIWMVSVVGEMMVDIPGVSELAIPEIANAIPTTIVFLVTAIMFYIIYGHITDTKPPRAAAVVSTFTMTALWVISGKVFSLYLGGFSAIGSIYGPYAFLLVLLLWIYYSSVIFVMGGIVGQAYWETLYATTHDQEGHVKEAT
jgi:membrane protein